MIEDLLSPKQRTLYAYLLDQVREGKRYFKAKHIARKIGLSAKEIGSLFYDLEQIPTGLRITRFAWSRSTTWRCEPA